MITAGLATNFEAREALLLASGANKAGAVAAAVEGEVLEEVPASVLRRHLKGIFLLDEDAGFDMGGGLAS